MNHRRTVIITTSAFLIMMTVILFYFGNRKFSFFSTTQNRESSLLETKLLEAKNLLSHKGDKDSLKKADLILKSAEISSINLSYPASRGKVLVLKADLLEQQGKKEAAIAEVNKAILLLKKTDSVSVLAEAYSRMGLFYGLEGEELAKRIAYFEESLKCYQLAGKKMEQANLLKEIGDFSIIGGDYLKAERVLDNALEIYKSINHPGLHAVYDLLNEVNTRLGNYNKALKYGRLAASIAEKNEGQTLLHCTIYNRLGCAQYFSKQFDTAELSFRKSLAIAEHFKDHESMMTVMPNLANSLIKNRKYDTAIADLSSFLKKGYAQNGAEVNSISFFMLMAYNGKGDVTNAEKYYRTLLNAVNMKASYNYEQYAYLEMIDYLLNRKKFVTARSLIKVAQSIYIKNSMADAIMHTYRLTFKADSLQGNLKASIRSYQKFKFITDSMFKVSREKQVEKLEQQFNAEVQLREELKDRNIQLLNTKGKLQAAELQQAKSRSFIFLSGTFFLVILLGIGYRAYTFKQRKNLLLEKQKKEIDQQNISMKRLIDQQVKLISEKEWLVKEVHHRVKNNLQIIVSLLNFQSKYLEDDAAKTAINNSKNRIKTMSIIHQRLYQADTLKFVDMKVYINELVHYFKDAFADSRHIEFVMTLSPVNLEVGQVVPIGLILNETVTNAIKYAFPAEQPNPRIRIGFEENPEGLYVLTIEDNGIGLGLDFDIKNTKSLGFNLIQTMSEQLYAELTIESNPGLKLTFRFRNDQTMNS